MRIQHNIAALNSHRNLTGNNNAVSKNLEKLSSGYRINRAGDDAAGLAISEKMRSQITGLTTAQKNAEDGVSLVQTAEGALTEVHSMLNRMVELATQSANGTYSKNNRTEMQKEITALKDEIDRISNTANFNGTKLFKGTDSKEFDLPTADLTATGKIGGANVPVTAATSSKFETGAYTFGADGMDGELSITYKDADGNEQTLTLDSIEAKTDEATTLGNMKAAIDADGTLADAGIEVTVDNDKLVFTSTATGTSAPAVTDFEYSATTDTATIAADSGTTTAAADATYDLSGDWEEGDSITINDKTYTFAETPDAKKNQFSSNDELAALLANDNITMNVDDDTAVTFTQTATTENANVKKIGLHVGETSSDDNTIEVNIREMSSATLKINNLSIETQDDAKAAIDTINAAIDSVSSIRSDLGAMQNRLEHTINNLGVQTENITAAESRIRDVDMAKEMMTYTKNNILVQASQAMLAQANQVPQGVLQLLQ